MIIKKNGMTLVEVLVAMFFLCFGVLGYFAVNEASNKSSMDSYYEALAFSLAREPIEIYRGLGYETMKKIMEDTSAAFPAYPVNTGTYIPIVNDPTSQMQYPSEAEMFERSIEFEPFTEGTGTEGSAIKGIKISVKVKTQGMSKAEAWMGRSDVKLESNVMELPR